MPAKTLALRSVHGASVRARVHYTSRRVKAGAPIAAGAKRTKPRIVGERESRQPADCRHPRTTGLAVDSGLALCEGHSSDVTMAGLSKRWKVP